MKLTIIAFGYEFKLPLILIERMGKPVDYANSRDFFNNYVGPISKNNWLNKYIHLMDNAPPHTGAASASKETFPILQAMNKCDFKTFGFAGMNVKASFQKEQGYPGRSPDFNGAELPINTIKHNMYEYLAAEAYPNNLKNAAQKIQFCANKAWENINQATIKKVFKHTWNNYLECLDCKGGYGPSVLHRNRLKKFRCDNL